MAIFAKLFILNSSEATYSYSKRVNDNNTINLSAKYRILGWREMEESESDPWNLLRICASDVRVEIVKSLLKHEMLSLSDIAAQLEKHGSKMALPGVFKHMSILEDGGIVRKEPGWIVEDARKTLYMIEGRERVEKLLQHLEIVKTLLRTGEMFVKAFRLARKIDSFGPKMVREERRALESLLDIIDGQQISEMLTEDEGKKVKTWKMSLTF